MNTSDRIIRIYNYADMLSCGINCDLEPKQKLQDLVNKSLWRKCCWSGDGEYICGASSRQHSLYIWETASGTLVTILRGTKGEALADVCWHPVRPIIASISSGVVSVWSHSQVENWSAFAPDFRELEENVEYNERESEFDVRDEDRSLDEFDLHGPPNKRQRSDTNGHERKFDDETIEIDVVNEQRIEALVSSDDEDINDQLVYLPCAPDIEDPDVECPASATNMAKPRPLSPSMSTRVEADELFEIQLPIPPVQDPHPYQNGMKPTRSVATPTTTVPDFSNTKRDNKQRRKGHSHSHGDATVSTGGIVEQTILLPKAIDAAVVTVTQSGALPVSTQTSQIKRQRARSTRLEGRKATDTAAILPNTQTSMTEETSLTSPVKPTRQQQTHSTDHHPDSIPQWHY